VLLVPVAPPPQPLSHALKNKRVIIFIIMNNLYKHQVSQIMANMVKFH